MSAADPKATVLVVEDDPDHCAIYAETLRRAGHTALCAATGESALVILRQMQDVVGCLITDIRLPGVDGWHVADAFRAAFPGRPVVYASGYPSDRKRCVPGSCFLEKPLLLSRLIAAVEDLSRGSDKQPVGSLRTLQPDPSKDGLSGKLPYRFSDDGLDVGWR